jgi:hypothetical protein
MAFSTLSNHSEKPSLGSIRRRPAVMVLSCSALSAVARTTLSVSSRRLHPPASPPAPGTMASSRSRARQPAACAARAATSTPAKRPTPLLWLQLLTSTALPLLLALLPHPAAAQGVAARAGDLFVELQPRAPKVDGRGLHSFTFQFNLSRV